MAYWIFIGTSSRMPVDVAKCDSMPVVRPHGAEGDWYKFVHEENAKQLIKERDRLQIRNEKLEKVVEAAKLWLISADIYSKQRLSSDRTVYKLDYMQGREIFRAALVELEQL